VQVCAISNCISNVDANTIANGPIRGLISVQNTNPLLYRQSTTRRAVYAVEYDQQRVTGRLDQPATILSYSWVDHISTQSTQAIERPLVVQLNEAAVAHHVGVQDGDQLSPIFGLSRLV
jgi:hypothetical protein